jgi:hypothetical protein
MAQPGPAAAVKVLQSVVAVSTPPMPAREVLVKVCIQQAWFGTPSEAEEAAERWEKAFLKYLRRELSEANRYARICLFDFNSAGTDLVQGAAFVEGTEPEAVQELKRRRGTFALYVAAMEGLSPDDFEALSRGMLHEIGVADPVVTQHSDDAGIDFYGRLTILQPDPSRPAALSGIYQRLQVWMVGQSKHYQETNTGTPDIRAIVGAVELARGKAYGSVGDKYPDLAIRVCDPVFYLFFTSGKISRDGWRLLDQSGVVGMDGNMVAMFLADHGVGWKDDQFVDEEFAKWVGEHRPRA